jgi:hypothetical protein
VACNLEVGYVQSNDGGTTWSNPTDVAGPFPVTWIADTAIGRMVGDYISTSFGSDNLAHGVFATATAPASGNACGSVLDNCREPMSTFVTGLASGSASSAGDAVLFSGNGGADANSLWNVVDNNGRKHRD